MRRMRGRHKPMQSNRRDGRGHWPAGRRRSAIMPAARRALIRQLRLALDRGISLRRLAEKHRVCDRTLRKWLTGEHFPMPWRAKRMSR